MRYIRIQLTRKLANCLDGINVSGCAVGDVLDLPERSAAMLIAEGWAMAVQAGALPLAARALPHDDSDPHRS